MMRIWEWVWWFVYDLTSFIVWFAWLALVIGLAIVEWRRRRRPGPPPELSDPICPKCGYLLVGLTGHVCPECGTDVERVGVLRAGDPRTSPQARAVVWALLLSPIAFYGWRWVEPRLPTRHEHSVIYVLNGPGSNAYRAARVTISSHRWVWPKPTSALISDDTAELRLTHLTGAEAVFRKRFSVQKARPQTRPSTSPTRQLSSLSQQDILDWMSAAGLDTADEQIQAEAATIANMVGSAGFRDPSNTAFARTAITYGGGYSGRPWWMLGAWIALCFLIWLLAVRRFARRRTLPYEQFAPQMSK